MRLIKIHDRDNVAVLLEPVTKGQIISINDQALTAAEDIEKGHKIALAPIAKGENVIKYGFPIGQATTDIAAGQWVHTHVIATNLGEILEYSYQPEQWQQPPVCKDRTFLGYRRPDGRVATRNEIWIIPTVSCVNRNIQLIARAATARYSDAPIDGIFEFTHPYGCSQMGEDMYTTQKVLANLVDHPNAGAVLVVGLGCENNYIDEFKKVLGNWDPERVKFLVAQEVEDEVEAGVELIGDLVAYASAFKREQCPASELVIGLKCGGSDGFSGITGNPLVGYFSDRLVACGGSTLLTEVPEMFGAETILMNRAINETVFEKTVSLINDFKNYFTAHNQVIYENPSPGNKRGGISTLEDKSLGCTQKGGTSPVVDVLPYGGVVTSKGLNLLSGPGNDAVACTALASAGCHVILFTTGRGTPLGTAVPCVKVSTNSDLYRRKSNWCDFDAGRLLSESRETIVDEFFEFVLEIAAGRKTKTEEMGFREIVIFKNGVTV